MKTNRLRISSLAAVSTALILQAGLASAVDVVDPASVLDSMAPSYSMVIAKTVQTPEIPPKPDIVFLADTTASMGGAIANVQANASSIMSQVAADTTLPWFAAAQYRDVGDTPLFAVDQGLTVNQPAVDAAISTWSVGGGGNTPEAQLNALNELATGAVSFRANSTRVIVWFGDASGHDPSNGITEAAATANLVAKEIRVIAIDVNTGFADGLDASGQATRITAATGGEYIPDATPDEVSDAILEGLSNLPITVVPKAIGCAPLNVSFSPASVTVTSGDPVSFNETIAVPSSSAHAGQTVDCTVEFQDDKGNLLVVDGESAIQDISIEIPLAIDLTPDTADNELNEDTTHQVDAYVSSIDVPLGLGGKDVEFVVTGTNGGAVENILTDANGEAVFTYSVPQTCDSLGSDTITGCTTGADGEVVCDGVTKNWSDNVDPVASCDEGVNPAGKKKPASPGKGGKAQNPDGFYQLNAEDPILNCDMTLTVTDGDGHVYTDLAPGDYIKYTEDNEIAQAQEVGDGVISWHLWGHGDLSFTATDTSGNESIAAVCLVPPPPK